MAGPIYILSAGLARIIVDTDRVHTALFQRYGTSSEDANMGKWAKYASEKHGLHVEYVADHRIFCGSGNIYCERYTKGRGGAMNATRPGGRHHSQ